LLVLSRLSLTMRSPVCKRTPQENGRMRTELRSLATSLRDTSFGAQRTTYGAERAWFRNGIQAVLIWFTPAMFRAQEA
jgi:hypothetical protein